MAESFPDSSAIRCSLSSVRTWWLRDGNSGGIYFKDMPLTGTGQQILGDLYIASSDLYYPKVYNIEMDPHEDLNVGGINLWTLEFAYKPIREYFESLKKYPNPPAPNLTRFTR